MRFEVPQFIEVEDKIFGPFTWRQFLYLGGGLGMAVVLFFTTNIIIFILLGLPLGILAGALAFYPVNNRPFSFFLEAIFNYVSGQHLYLWRKKSDIIHKSATPTKSTFLPGTNYTAPPINQNPTRKNLHSLAKKLELQALQKTE